MKKSLLIILLLIFIFLAIGSSIGIFSFVKGSYLKKIEEKTAETASIENEIDKIKGDRDSNNYLPSDVVKNFMAEVKAVSLDKAKLYLSENTKSIDILKELNLGFSESAIAQKDVQYEISGDEANVNYYYFNDNGDADQENLLKFLLVKENSIWKIVSFRKL